MVEGEKHFNVPKGVFVGGVSLVFNGDLILVDGIFISSAITVEVLKYSFRDLKCVCCLVKSLK